MEVHNEPLADEAASYFGYLPSKPRMVARTNCGTPYRPMVRVLAPINDATIVSLWCDALRDSLLDSIRERNPRFQWTGYMPLRVEARSLGWDTPSSESHNFLFVCVAPETTAWRDALDAALDCKAVLNTYGITNMDVVVTEMAIVAPGAGDLEDKGDVSATDENEPCNAPANGSVELQDIFDIRFSMPKFNRNLAQINLAVLPFLPLPGQSLQQTDPNDVDKELPAGSLGCFLRLKDEHGNLSETLYALTSRHVAVQGAHNHSLVLNNEPASGASEKYSNKDITIACGSLAVIEKQQRRLRDLKKRSSVELGWETRITFAEGEPSDKKIAEFELIEECVNKYLPALQSAVESLASRDGSCPRTRLVGSVAFSAEHSIDDEGFWKDWALVAVSSPGSPSPAQYRHFYHSKVLLGHWADVAERVDDLLADDSGDGDYTTTPYIMDDAELLTIRPPHPPMLFRGRNTRTAPRVVIKRGAVSNLTVGLLSPIEAVLRRPLPGFDVIAWAWPVFSCVLNPASDVHHGKFSTGGDSGSMVLDTDGIAVGMLDAGFGSDSNKTRRLFVPQDQGQDPTEMPTALPSATHHTMADLEEPPQAQIDISLITPIDRIFASIKDVTGRTPHIV